MIKVYTHKSKLKFGKYKGKTVLDVVKDDPQYIVWCLSNLRSFLILEKDMGKLRKVNEAFDLNDEEEYKYLEKLEFFEMVQERTRIDEDLFAPGSKGSKTVPSRCKRLTKEDACEKLSKKSLKIMKEVNLELFEIRMKKYNQVNHLVNLILDDYNDWNLLLDEYIGKKDACKKRATSRNIIIAKYMRSSDAEEHILRYNKPPNLHDSFGNEDNCPF